MKTDEPLVGHKILNLLTLGMYKSPLDMYREYIQNAADAFGSAHTNTSRCIVKVEINPSISRVSIRDNGPGLSKDEAVRELSAIGRSSKDREKDRGFRGFGRLAGLAFADSVAFITRRAGDKNVWQVAWAKPADSGIDSHAGADAAIRKCVSISELPSEDYPNHFFEVVISGISRHAASLLLNENIVRSYISEVCPVPFSDVFPFGENIETLLSDYVQPMTISVLVNKDTSPITRPHGAVIPFSDDRESRFLSLEPLVIYSGDRRRVAGAGWIAHSSYLGAIKRNLSIRGMRVRQGNIQIGGDDVFDSLFLESRFNRWCVGEIHILDPRIVPNARRDYFEPGPHLRNLENEMAPVLRRVTAHCRTSSFVRNKERKLMATVRDTENAFNLATSGYLTARDARKVVADALARIHTVKQGEPPFGGNNQAQLDEVEEKLQNFEARKGRPAFGRIKPREIQIYRHVFMALTQVLDSHEHAKKVMESVIHTSIHCD